MSSVGQQIDPVAALAQQQGQQLDPVNALASGQYQTYHDPAAPMPTPPPPILDRIKAYGTGLAHGMDLPSLLGETGMEVGTRATDALGITKGAYPMLHQNFKDANYFGEDPNSTASQAGHIVGGMIGSAPLAGVAPFEGAGVLGAMGNGAIQGGLTSLVNSPNSDAPLWQQVGLGTLTGGGFGGGFKVAGKGLGALLRSGTDPAAVKLLESIDPKDVQTIANSSKPMTLMDTGGPNSAAQRLGRALVTMPGDQSADITEFLNKRSSAQRGRILADISQMAPDTDTYGNNADLSAQRSEESSPLYRQAFSNPIVPSEHLDYLQNSSDIQQGMRQGIKIQQRKAFANNIPFDPNAYGVTGFNSAGDPIIGPSPSWRTWHAAREGLDDMIYSQADPNTGILPKTKEIGSLQDLRRGLNGTLTTLNPDLATADAAWSGPSQKMDAIRLGSQILRADPEQITQATGRMNQDTRPYYQVGAGRALRDVVNDARDNANISPRLTGDQTARDQISAAFPGGAQQFQTAMDAENTMAQTKNAVLGGSQTANKFGDLAAPNGFGAALGKTLAGAVGGAAIGGPTGAVAGAVGPLSGMVENAVSGKIAKLFPQMSQDTAQKLGQVLTASGPSGAAQYKALTDPAISAFQRSALAKALIDGLSAPAVGGAALLSSNPEVLQSRQSGKQRGTGGN